MKACAEDGAGGWHTMADREGRKICGDECRVHRRLHRQGKTSQVTADTSPPQIAYWTHGSTNDPAKSLQRLEVDSLRDFTSQHRE